MFIENVVADTWIYDVNVFASSDEADELDTIQPSIWYEKINGASDRVYLNAFKVPASERLILRTLFGEGGWGWDFFISLDEFLEGLKGLCPLTAAALLKLPKINDQFALIDFTFDKHGEIIWECEVKDNYEY